MQKQSQVFLRQKVALTSVNNSRTAYMNIAKSRTQLLMQTRYC